MPASQGLGEASTLRAAAPSVRVPAARTPRRLPSPLGPAPLSRPASTTAMSDTACVFEPPTRRREQETENWMRASEWGRCVTGQALVGEGGFTIAGVMAETPRKKRR